MKDATKKMNRMRFEVLENSGRTEDFRTSKVLRLTKELFCLCLSQCL